MSLRETIVSQFNLNRCRPSVLTFSSKLFFALCMLFTPPLSLSLSVEAAAAALSFFFLFRLPSRHMEVLEPGIRPKPQ